MVADSTEGGEAAFDIQCRIVGVYWGLYIRGFCYAWVFMCFSEYKASSSTLDNILPKVEGCVKLEDKYLYARRHFLFPPLNIEEYNNRVMAVVRTEAQDAMLQKLLTDNYLSEEERDVLRWGKNSSSSKTRTKKRVGVAVYNSASSLETLVGYLYLTNTKRLEEIMLKLGFSSVTSPI
ncbi:hypothetical protein C3L33_00177, partial [Rhododendron williamsianum]